MKDAGGVDTTVCIDIDLGRQELRVQRDTHVLKAFPVNTAANGAGERLNSECTPRGQHVIHAMIGDGCPINTVFVGRQATGEIYSGELAGTAPNRDWILTRILWLAGVEPGVNCGADVDTLERYVYLHGCPDDASFERPASHGCVRMRNVDIVDLFERVEEGTRVYIHE